MDLLNVFTTKGSQTVRMRLESSSVAMNLIAQEFRSQRTAGATIRETYSSARTGRDRAAGQRSGRHADVLPGSDRFATDEQNFTLGIFKNRRWVWRSYPGARFVRPLADFRLRRNQRGNFDD